MHSSNAIRVSMAARHERAEIVEFLSLEGNGERVRPVLDVEAGRVRARQSHADAAVEDERIGAPREARYPDAIAERVVA